MTIGSFGELKIAFSGQMLCLSSLGSVWWPQNRTLFVADLHLGKAETFRSKGLPVPLGSGSETLARLRTLVGAYQARKVVILGDLWHSKSGRTISAEAELREWREEFSSLEMTLVLGNHDLRSGAIDPSLRIDLASEGTIIDEVEINHHPKSFPVARLSFAGHVHPAIRLVGKGGLRATLPCFWCRRNEIVLPAFGAFTGMKVIRLEQNESAYAILDKSVFYVQ